MKKWFLIGGAVLLAALLGVGFLVYRSITSWETYSFGLGDNKTIVKITYPAKYKDKISNNANLPNQKVGLLSIPNVINFQLSGEAHDKDIASYAASIAALNSSPETDEEKEAPKKETPSYKTVKYGRNKVYFLNEYNQSPDFVAGDIFDGRGHRLNFTYHSKNVNKKEIKSIISKIKF